MDNRFVSSKKASQILNVHPNTLRTWEEKGLIETFRLTQTSQRKYNIEKFLKENKANTKENICYCRVSSKSQEEDLKNQVKFLKEKFPNYEIITDIGSGLNYKRKGLRTILDKAIKGTIGQIVVTYKDRLCRFGYEVFEYIVELSGGEILVLNTNENTSLQQEMVEDLTSIIHVFSCRLYGSRKYKNKTKETTKEIM